jgi:hypothetical protein
MKTKVSKVIVTLVILFTISFIFYRYHIPDVHIKYYKANVHVAKIPLRWGFITPPETILKKYSALDSVKNFYAIPVYPESMLTFIFEKQPDHYEIYLWKGSQMINYVPIDSGLSIVVPSKGGSYIFTIRGLYSQGEVDYVFWVDVM